jgi:WD40 repeat protein
MLRGVPGRIPEDVAERVLATHPLPIADAFGALVAADSPFEQRDRVVEVFRATLRTLSAFTLAARVQYGPGPGSEPGQIAELIRSLRGRGLTDGQWFAVVREMLRPWSGAPGSYPLAALVTLVHGKKAELPRLVDELLVMRKSETVAHGASGTKAAILEILDRRVPQLLKLLALLDPLWARARLLVPLSNPDDEAEAQSAWSLMGYTPPRGRWRRVTLAPGVRLTPGEALLTDADHRPVLALHPLVLVRRPSPEAIEEFFTLDGGSKKGAVFVALPSMAEHRETEAWAALSRALSGEDAPPDSTETSGVERPFRGLSSFGPEHAALFFGREEQTEALANRVRRHAFVTVTGPSGSGKTSLLRAGALPQLSDYQVVVLRPGAEPLDSLAHRLAEGLGAWVTEAEIARRLREDPSGVTSLVSEWSRGAQARAPAPDGAPPSAGLGTVYRVGADAAAPKLVIVVDQSEEVFTLCLDETKRLAFARALAALGSSPDAPCRVVLSVREDFFARFATLLPLRGLYSQTVEVVTTPDREALARTLYLPAKQFAYAFEDESLVTTMVDAVASEPAALALLQFCADRLWEVRDRTWKRLSWDAYRALGGVEGALAAHADRTLSEMSASRERAAKGLMLRLVTAERTRAAASRRELLETAASRDDTEAVLDRLISARLLTVSESDDGSDARVEIVHEALIRHWGRLAAWLSEDEEGQRLLHATRQAAREWDARGRAKGLLWGGEALSDLRRWRKRSTERLAGIEAAFVEASEAEEQRSRRLRRLLSAGAFLATGAFGAFMFWQWRAAESARAQTEQARARAEIRGLVSEARNLEPLGRTGKALALLRAATALEDHEHETGPTAVSIDMERLGRAGAAALVLSGHGAQVGRMAISADRGRIATASSDGTAKIWDTGSGMLLHTLGDGGNGGNVVNVAYSPDGKTVATGTSSTRGDSGTARLWDARTGALKRVIETKAGIGRVLFSPDGALLCVVLDEGGVALFHPETGEPAGAFGGMEEGAEDAVFSADGERLATLQATNVRVYEVTRRALSSTFKNSAGQVMAVAFSPDGAALGVTSGGFVRLLDPATGAEIRALETPDPGAHDNGKMGAITSLAFSPDGKLVAAGGMDDLVRVWDAATGQIKHQLRRHKEQVTSVAFSPDSSRLASSAMDGTAAVWDMASGALVEHLRGHEAEIYRVEFVTPDRVATISYDRTARLWDISDGPYVRTLSTVSGGLDRTAVSLESGRLAVARERTASVFDIKTGATIADLSGHVEQVSALAISPDGTRVGTGTAEGAARIWDVGSARIKATLGGHGKGVSAIQFSRNGKRIATGAVEGGVRLWDADSGARVAELLEHPSHVSSLVFSNDDRLLASGSWDGTITIWTVAEATKRHGLRGGQGRVTKVVFSANGETLAAAIDAEVKLWDTATGQLRATLGGYEQSVLAMAFSKDDRTLAAVASDGYARLWSVPEGKPIRDYRAPVNGGYDVAFSPDGERLFVAGGEGQVFVWQVATGTLVESLMASAREPGLSMESVIPIGNDQLLTASRDGSLMVFRAPPVDRHPSLLETGQRTNYRVCRKDFRVIALASQPPADTVWAPDEACAEEGPAKGKADSTTPPASP